MSVVHFDAHIGELGFSSETPYRTSPLLAWSNQVNSPDRHVGSKGGW